jgi:dolichol-phosphate mannosyltransferase
MKRTAQRKQPLISVVTPVYSAERILPELYSRLCASLEAITRNFEIIMVNDASPQKDWEVIRGLAKKDRRVRGINLSRNFGQHHAITAGLDASAGEWVVVMDCDLQDRPEEIGRLYEKAREGYDIVLARRTARCDWFGKRLSSWLFYKVYDYFTQSSYDSSIANFSIVRRIVIDNLLGMGEQNRNYPLSLKWLGFNSCTVDVQHAPRFEGKTSYSVSRLMRLSVDSIVSQSNRPLVLSIKMGFIFSALSLCYAAHIVYRYIVHGIPVLGWPSVIVSIWFIGGLLFANLGIIGLYLGRVFNEAKGRPLYVVRETLNLGDGK